MKTSNTVLLVGIIIGAVTFLVGGPYLGGSVVFVGLPAFAFAYILASRNTDIPHRKAVLTVCGAACVITYGMFLFMWLSHM